MSFKSPWMLVVLVALPVVIAAYVSSRRRRSQRAAALAAQAMVATGAGSRGGWRRHIPFALFVAAFAVLGVSLARPSMKIRTPRREATVVLAMDVSNSMAATDIKPTRMEAARSAAHAFIAKQSSSVRIGVVAFGPGAVVVQNPTLVHADAVAAIDHLSIGGGTSLAEGLITSLGVIAGKPITIDPNVVASDAGQVDIGYFGSATIIVFSDGENTSQLDPVAVADVASVAGVKVQSIGVGTEAGAVVQVDGFSVATALNKDLLTQVATHSDGAYHQADDTAGLVAISRAINLKFKVITQVTEVTALFSAIGTILLLAGALISVIWFGRVL